MAFAWESASGLPPEIAALFDAPAELLLAVPEHKVPLPGGSRDSQNDVFALVRHGGGTSAVAVEGKVAEPFGATIGDWYGSPTPGRTTRLQHICALLGLDFCPPAVTRYQLLHRAASAVIEAKRFGTDEAAMIVHSFAQDHRWFEDFQSFAQLFGAQVERGRPALVATPSGRLRLGWATGDPKYLTA